MHRKQLPIMDPLSRLIDIALGSKKQTYHKVLPSEHDNDTGLFSVTAIFIYSNETTAKRTFPRKPTGLTKKINNRFERPISVKFKLMDPDFRPKQRKNLEEWKAACKAACRETEK
jgi:hypothetical protein